jgi:SAM-dependent methyltransferase
MATILRGDRLEPDDAREDERHERVKTYDFDAHLDIVDAEKQYKDEQRYYQRFFSSIEDECRSASSFLDVGCGTGHLLECMGEAYPEMYRAGIELNHARSEKARQTAQCEIYEMPVEEFRTDRAFDAITMINVLSHIPSFDSLFAALHRLLNPGGKLIIRIGEFRQDIMRNDRFNWEIPDHLHFCGYQTIEFMAARYRFSVVRHDRVPYSQELFHKVRWQTPGTSALRDVIKSVVVAVPFSLPLLAKLYDLQHGG